ncbi:homoserine O-succinyltransferase [Barrientosiimonas marina]|uniref:Homoserine O-acetyltransferase n=1 Tax=Lentibacillus kimchii TaxID=1542911 RepID=A0ABW2UV64_9BACI
MPINVSKELPASDALKQENIFVMDEDRAQTQDIRPLNILILNLMPEKERTELQLLRLLGNTPLQVNICFLQTATHQPTHTSAYHLDNFYTTFNDIKTQRFDGLIITGAPVEQLAFEDVTYWNELTTIMDWAENNVTSVLHICWGAQASLYYHYGISKYDLPEKYVGIYKHYVQDTRVKLMHGFDDIFHAPHSRFTGVSKQAVEAHTNLTLLAASEDGAPFIIISDDAQNIMVTGHLEYDATTLREEYERDRAKGAATPLPENYFPNDNINEQPPHMWRSHSHLLFANWLNYYVYQETPYEWHQKT